MIIKSQILEVLISIIFILEHMDKLECQHSTRTWFSKGANGRKNLSGSIHNSQNDFEFWVFKKLQNGHLAKQLAFLPWKFPSSCRKYPRISFLAFANLGSKPNFPADFWGINELLPKNRGTHQQKLTHLNMSTLYKTGWRQSFGAVLHIVATLKFHVA